MCGEKSVTYTLLERCGGSPPRMRGKALKDGGGSLDIRITPAYAGKSAIVRIIVIAGLGSPPHVRGKDVE